MKFDSLYRISLYFYLFLASLVLNMDSEEIYPKFYPIVMAICAVAAFLTVDRNPKLGLSRWLANLLAIGSVFLVYLEIRLVEDQLVLACGHWLFYLVLVYTFRAKSATDDWYLILLGLIQVLVGSFLSQSDRVGMTLLAWALTGLWVLALFYLHREAQSAGLDPRSKTREPYPGLLGWPFFFAAFRATLTTLLLGGFIFLIMPRSPGAQQQPSNQPVPRAMSGFSEEVRLGQMGEILENETVVMSIEMLDEQGHRVTPDEELLWRGIILTGYDKGRWTRSVGEYDLAPSISSIPWIGGQRLTQRIRLEEYNSDVAFGLRPILRIDVEPRERLMLNRLDGSIVRDEASRRPLRIPRRRRSGPIDYSVQSLIGDDLGFGPGIAYQPEEYTPPFPVEHTSLARISDELRSELDEIARPIVAELPSDDPIMIARALESYLRDSGEFTYTLRMGVVDPSVDPIVDFLRNRKAGHCEYYASALVMLLRSQGIPCRMVNGFKGGDWNDLARVLTVRQKHAHSWVEVYLGGRNLPGIRGRVPVWLTLDPTPPDDRVETVMAVSRFPTGFRQLTDFARYVWIFYVAGFNAERQERLLYEPIRNLINEARGGFGIMRRGLVDLLRWMTDFPSVTAFFSVKGFFVSFFVMLLMVGAYRVGRWVWGWLASRVRGAAADDLDRSSVLGVYNRLMEILAASGLERPASETPREFALRASVLLRTRAELQRSLAEIPSQVVDALYSVRFGGRALTPDRIEQLESRVNTLESSLRPNAA